jgi:transposase
MIPVSAGARVWIATGHTDMRKGMQGLALLCRRASGEIPLPATSLCSVVAPAR